MLQFHKLPNIQSADKIITERLTRELSAHNQVLWLLSGGSNIGIEVAALAALPDALLPNLTMMLSDERFGPYGHNDSNMQQLYDAGFAPRRAKVIPVIVPESLPLEATASHFADNFRTALAAADVCIAQLGMGVDGHIAGILPETPAVTATGLVASYTTESYERISLTFEALRQITAAYVFVFGQDKQKQLVRLRDKELPLGEQPAQFLKQLSEAYVYNDQVDTETAMLEGGSS